jgi:hypothetical protein
VRWFARGFAVTIAVALGLALVPSASQAGAGTYTATADARLVGVDLTVAPPIAFDQLVDAGLSVAQARIDSLGTTQGFASSPYPSQSVVLLPGLIAGITNGQTSALIPPYPLIAATSATMPSDHRELGTLVLDAESSPGNSRGSVTDGVTRGLARTTADDDTVVARAETSITSLQLTSTLSLDGVHTVAEARRSSEGKVTLSSSFEVAGLTIFGRRVALTPTALSLLGTEVPLGVDLSSVLGQLLSSLAGQGTTIAFVPATRTADTITSAGLSITSNVAVPPEIASGLKEVRAGVTVGFASASVSNGVEGGVTGPAGPATDEAPLLAAPSITPGIGFDAPVLRTPTATGGVRPAAAPTGVSAGHPLPVDISLSGLYPVLALGAAIGVGLVNLIRHLGVRSP